MGQDINVWSFEELSTVTAPEVQMVPDGDYSIQVKSAEVTTSRRSGTPQLMLGFEILKAKDGGVEHRGKKGNTFISLDKSNTWAALNFKQLCEAVNGKTPKGRVCANTDDFVNRPLEVRIKTSKYTRDDGTEGSFYSLNRYRAL